jgi:hypothetical protein
MHKFLCCWFQNLLLISNFAMDWSKHSNGSLGCSVNCLKWTKLKLCKNGNTRELYIIKLEYKLGHSHRHTFVCFLVQKDLYICEIYIYIFIYKWYIHNCGSRKKETQKIFSSFKNGVHRMEKIFATYTSDKELITRIYNEHRILNSPKNQWPNEEMGKWIEQRFFKGRNPNG